MRANKRINWSLIIVIYLVKENVRMSSLLGISLNISVSISSVIKINEKNQEEWGKGEIDEECLG